MFGLVIFVFAATVLPAVAIPVGFALSAYTALAPPGGRDGRTSRRQRHPAVRLLRPVSIFTLIAILLVGLVLPATATLQASDSSGVGIARLRVFPEGSTGNPTADPNYVEDDPDPWIQDSWVIEVSENVATFGIVVRNYHCRDTFDVYLRIAVNDASLVTVIDTHIMSGDFASSTDSFGPGDFVVGTPLLANGMAWPSHGIYPTAFTSLQIGTLNRQGVSGDAVLVRFEVDGDFINGLKVHFDADGWTDDVSCGLGEGRGPNLSEFESNVRNPNSADTTVLIPSVTSVVVPVALAGLLSILVLRRKGKSPKT